MAKREKVTFKSKDGKKNTFLVSPSYKKEKACNHECNHTWHLVKSIDNFFINQIVVTFICDRCGKIKVVNGDYEL